MGCLFSSSKPVLPDSNGDETEFYKRYLPDHVLGKGEFGTVKLVHEIGGNNDNSNNKSDQYACKFLPKGSIFRDNTLYPPVDRITLQRECEILRTLAGKNHCLWMVGCFEGPNTLFIVTECCEGGEMIPHVSTYYAAATSSTLNQPSIQSLPPSEQSGGLTTDDVSRMSKQLLDAINHCFKNGVIHRDIKPENVMFSKAARGSSLRLIDFGSGTIDSMIREKKTNCTEATTVALHDGTELARHTTFAGSAFYTSPEMFQRSYTARTDVWSVGATLYVLVAGYPTEKLQVAFNKLQSSRDTDKDARIAVLRSLPNMPLDLPESFFEMLAGALCYRHRKRASAADLMNSEFANLHIHGNDGDNKELSVSHHSTYIAYGRYERSVTTLLATVLTTNQLGSLLCEIQTKLSSRKVEDEHYDNDEVEVDLEGEVETSTNPASSAEVLQTGKTKRVTPAQHEEAANRGRLRVILLRELKEILETQNHLEVISMIDGLPGSSSYNNFAYHVSLLLQFFPNGADGGDAIQGSKTEGRTFKDDSVDNTVHRKFRLAMSSFVSRKSGADSKSSNARNTGGLLSPNNEVKGECKGISGDGVGHLDVSGHGRDSVKELARAKAIAVASRGNTVHGNNVWDALRRNRNATTARVTSAEQTELGSSSHM